MDMGIQIGPFWFMIGSAFGTSPLFAAVSTLTHTGVGIFIGLFWWKCRALLVINGALFGTCRALYIMYRALFILCRALMVPHRALPRVHGLLCGALSVTNWAHFTRYGALFIRYRALFTRYRALFMRYNALFTFCRALMVSGLFPEYMGNWVGLFR